MPFKSALPICGNTIRCPVYLPYPRPQPPNNNNQMSCALTVACTIWWPYKCHQPPFPHPKNAISHTAVTVVVPYRFKVYSYPYRIVLVNILRHMRTGCVLLCICIYRVVARPGYSAHLALPVATQCVYKKKTLRHARDGVDIRVKRLCTLLYSRRPVHGPYSPYAIPYTNCIAFGNACAGKAPSWKFIDTFYEHFWECQLGSYFSTCWNTKFWNASKNNIN